MHSNREGRGFESLISHKASQKCGAFFLLKLYEMFYTYILFSVTINKYYVGASEKPEERLKKHLYTELTGMKLLSISSSTNHQH